MALDPDRPRGFSFLFKAPGSPCKHLYVIVSGQDANGVVMAVNISTGQNYYDGDDRCKLNVGDHPFVKGPSSALYSKALLIHITQLQSDLISSVIVEKEKSNKGLVKRIQDGARDDNQALAKKFEAFFSLF